MPLLLVLLLVALAEGSHVDACVLDVAKTTGIIELSLLPELTQLAKAAAAGKSNSSKKASKKAAAAVEEQQQHQLLLPAIGSEVQAMVQLIKDHYVVLSVLQQQQQQQGVKGKSAKAAKAAAAAANGPQQQQQHIAIGFLARGDLNSQGSAAKESQRFSRGQILAVIVAAAAATDNGGRLLLELAEPLAAAAAKGPGKAAAKDSAAVKPTTGGLVTATVVAVHELELEVVFGKVGAGRRPHRPPVAPQLIMWEHLPIKAARMVEKLLQNVSSCEPLASCMGQAPWRVKQLYTGGCWPP